MKCPSCDFDTGNKKICPNCGYDLRVYEKAKKISITFYNKGLSYIKNGCISQGINFLEKSIQFDKKNINSRNLLGLAYMYLGRIGESLKQWIISAHIKKDDNIAHEYIEIAQKNKSKLAKYDESITMYNEAVSYIKEKNEDMAIIRLKKAIYLSENFLEAYKLLTLCYMIQNNYERAMDTIERATQIDYNNQDLINYYKELNPNTTIVKSEISSEKEKIQKIYMKPRVNANINKKRLLTSLTMLFGVIFVGGLSTLIVFNFFFSGELNKLKVENQDNLLKMQSYENTINTLNNTIDELKAENQRLMQEKASIDQIKLLNQASEFLNNNNIEQAALKIKLIEKETLTQEETARYERIYSKTVPVVAKQFYDKGKVHYNNARYDDALINFEKSIYYSSAENVSDDALYYSGLAYEKKGNKQRALEYMDKIISDYKESDKYTAAEKKKKELSE